MSYNNYDNFSDLRYFRSFTVRFPDSFSVSIHFCVCTNTGQNNDGKPNNYTCRLVQFRPRPLWVVLTILLPLCNFDFGPLKTSTSCQDADFFPCVCMRRFTIFSIRITNTEQLLGSFLTK